MIVLAKPQTPRKPKPHQWGSPLIVGKKSLGRLIGGVVCHRRQEQHSNLAGKGWVGGEADLLKEIPSKRKTLTKAPERATSGEMPMRGGHQKPDFLASTINVGGDFSDKQYHVHGFEV